METNLRNVLLGRPDLMVEVKSITEAPELKTGAYASEKGFFLEGNLLDVVKKGISDVMKVILQDIKSKYVTDPNYVLPDIPNQQLFYLAKFLPMLFFGSGTSRWASVSGDVIDTILRLLGGELLEDHVTIILGNARLKRVGSSFTFGGYEYFEVIDLENKHERLLCRARIGGQGALIEGIEVFLNARVEGTSPDCVPDPDYPATATGHLETGNKDDPGLKEAIGSAGDKLSAYRQWLAAPGRRIIKTKYLDEFYTHYAHPTT